MTRGDLDKLREKYSFPPGIQLRIPGEGETILSTCPNEVAFYEAAFPVGGSGEVQDPFSNLFPSGPSSCSDSKLESLLDLGFPPSLDLMLVHAYQKGWREEGCDQGHELGGYVPTTLGDWQGGHAATFTQEDQVQQGLNNAVRRLLAPEGPSTLLGNNLGPGTSMMSSALVARKILNGVILPTNKEKVDQFTTDELVTNSFHTLGQAIKIEAELKDKSEAMAWLKAEVAELTGKLARAKKLAIDEFKSLNDFKDAITDSATTYFGKGFEFCKRQLLHHHPNLGIDLAGIKMDTDLAEEEEAVKVVEEENENKGETNPSP
ncbi:hypothetical protein Acr_00g0034030 [Actinidia rufa]|uniref:Uncharacterized protein n=1 Tax=Actinidia rufa TaxID=165716 RepID=A0A7J0DHR8_9ERIC|nr:hypothetical protein Acr_00g0034030 [Actinidia rufa]